VIGVSRFLRRHEAARIAHRLRRRRHGGRRAVSWPKRPMKRLSSSSPSQRRDLLLRALEAVAGAVDPAVDDVLVVDNGSSGRLGRRARTTIRAWKCRRPRGTSDSAGRQIVGLTRGEHVGSSSCSTTIAS
jgi:hypothetical protein